MDDLAELALEGATVGAIHYDKVTDPLKDQAKKLPNPVRKLRGQQGQNQNQNQGQDWNHSDMDDDDHDYDRPRRSNTDRDRWGSRRDRDVEVEDDEDYNSRRRSSTIQRSPRRDRRRGGDGYIEETYERRSGRAKSTGRDGYDRGGGRGLRRDDRRRSHRKQYDSDSESSRSPSPHRRKSLGEKALVALGLGGAGAAAEHAFDEHRRDRYRSPPRRRHRESDRSYDRPRDFGRDDRPRRAETFSNSSSQYRSMPAGYLGANVPERDLRLATRQPNPSQSAVTTRRPEAGSTTTREAKRSPSSSSSDSSSLCSSSEDDRRIKKIRGKEYLTAGLAAVATIHAAHGVYSSMEARDQRHEELAKGEITPQEARRLRNKARIQDVAAIGIAALGIKSAYGEWKEVQESRHEVGTQREEQKKRHEKRLKRAEKEARKQRENEGRRDGRNGYRSA